MNLLKDDALEIIDLARIYPVRSQDRKNLASRPAADLVWYLEARVMEAIARGGQITSFRFLCSVEEADRIVAALKAEREIERREQQEYESKVCSVNSAASRTVYRERLDVTSGAGYTWQHIAGTVLAGWNGRRM